MKIEIEILPEQLDLLDKIKILPLIIEAHLSKIPQSFPGGETEISRIKELCESLEFKWKRWVFDCLVAKNGVESILDKVVLARKSEYMCDEDAI